MNGTLLVYGYHDEKRRNGIDEMARHFDFTMRYVTEKDAGKTVACLLGLADCDPAPSNITAPLPAIDFVLLHQVPETLHRELFTYMRDHDIATGHKAIVTPTNREWTLEKLLRENDAEHKIVTMWQNLRHALAYGNALEEKFGEDPSLHQALTQAKPYETLTEDTPLSTMADAYRQLVKEVLRVDQLHHSKA